MDMKVSNMLRSRTSNAVGHLFSHSIAADMKLEVRASKCSPFWQSGEDYGFLEPRGFDHAFTSRRTSLQGRKAQSPGSQALRRLRWSE
ncbi:hypothetical protein R1flu_018526 [Riccia fluitans]|uniref:Uncharacterized protein n=1 Tax=Riccia fluitans TaxID=41844 RepID=A0ABD1ZG33_9MARC